MHIPYESYAIISRQTTPEALAWQRRLEEHLHRRHADLRAVPPHEAHLLLVCGGDGTLLDVMRSEHATRAHVLGFNTGHAGFLSTVRDAAQFTDMLDAALAGQLIPMEVPVMQIVHRSTTGETTGRAINDVLMERTMTWITMRVEAVHGETRTLLREIRGSGVLVCSPIGSTTPMAVHFPAPRIDPTMRAWYVKGVNDARTSLTGMLIAAGDQQLRITITDIETNLGIPEHLRQLPSLFADGVHHATVAIGDTITIAYAPEPAILLRVSGDAHWDRVRSLPA
ncbi:MAG: NAD(+)/NADH kinase [bacterium]|nr:NAD(+)/NADH kinase [bacterium]